MTGTWKFHILALPPWAKFPLTVHPDSQVNLGFWQRRRAAMHYQLFRVSIFQHASAHGGGVCASSQSHCRMQMLSLAWVELCRYVLPDWICISEHKNIFSYYSGNSHTEEKRPNGMFCWTRHGKNAIKEIRLEIWRTCLDLAASSDGGIV